MKKILKILISIAALGVIWYQFGDIIQVRFFPCKNPILYTLGGFDGKFGISKNYFLGAVADAEAIWEKPQGKYLGRNLFSYKENPKESENILKINLIYDYRQDATKKLSNLGIAVEDNRASYDSLKAKFTALKAEYEREKKVFEAQVEAFNKKQDRSLQEADSLKAEQKRLNKMVEEINALVAVLNRLASTLNISVDQYNTIGETRGESFTEGVYESDGWSRHIDIYEFSSRAKLVRVLAHELGHALGLEHVEDPKAIMYELNQDNNETLTAADLAALGARCGEE